MKAFLAPIDASGRWLVLAGRRIPVIRGGSGDTDVDDPPADTPPADTPPADPPSPTPEQEAARLREENARLRGQVEVLSTRPATPAVAPAPPADPIATEYAQIQKDFAAGEYGEDERTMRLGKLGAKAEIARREAEQREDEARQRDEQSKRQSNDTVGVYMQRRPALADPESAEFKRVMPVLHAVAKQYGWDVKDPRAQALALERTYGPIGGAPPVDTREFERRRHPGGGGGGSFGDDTPPPPKPQSQGERLFNKLLPEHQTFFITTRGSKEAAIKTLEYADEHQMRKQGRFREGTAA